jgi:hypothetical protein
VTSRNDAATARGGGLDGSFITVLALGFVLLVAVAAVVIPWTEAARDAARAEQFQQRIADLAEQEAGRLSLSDTDRGLR